MADRTSDASSAQKDPDEWVTGDEPVTAAPASSLNTLAREAGEQVDNTVAREAGEQVDVASLTKAEASTAIDELQDRTGRGS